jgi:hypothetical protein
MENGNPKPRRAQPVETARPGFIQTLRHKEQRLIRSQEELNLQANDPSGLKKNTKIPALDLASNPGPSFLPLELFDDIDKFEKLRPKDWLHRENSDGEKAHAQVNGCSRWFYSDGTWIWQPCSILQYDEEVDRYGFSHRLTRKVCLICLMSWALCVVVVFVVGGWLTGQISHRMAPQRQAKIRTALESSVRARRPETLRGPRGVRNGI